MTDLVQYSTRGAVGVITLANPPVNAFSAAVRAGVLEALEGIMADDALTAAVITGSGKLFSGGADIREFNTPAGMQSPNLPELIEKTEAFPKPIVAALHGTAVGGALELSMACHYRVAAAGTRLGLPEVTLGIVPGAGGTQRMPRLVGAEAALDLIVGGRRIKAEEALELGLIDEVAESDVVDAAVALAERVAAEGGPPRRTSEMEDRVAADRERPEIFEEYRKKMARKARGLESPYACVECIEAAVSKPFTEGLAFERQTFVRCVESAQSRALQHAFFAERESGKVPGVTKETPTRPIERAAVIGGGTMGTGITMCFANAGIPVTIIEVAQDGLDGAMKTMEGTYAGGVKRGRMSQDAMDACMGLITPSLGYDTVADVDLVVEAVFEDMALKKEIFGKLDEICAEGAILATNTSTLDIDEIARSTSRPGSVVGLHFFSPANIMRLLEIVRGEATSPETLATAMAIGKQLRKQGVVVGVRDGFVANGMFLPYIRESEFLLEEGATPEQVDRVIFEFGFPMGPFQTMDMAGLDVGWRIRQAAAATRPEDERYSPVADRICEMGRMGLKTEAGWYLYEEGSRTPVPDPEITAMIEASSAEQGIERREISDQEILERCLYPLVNLGAGMLEERVALRSSDIDVIWMHGFGFPRYHGGPMFWADQIGLGEVHRVMQELHEKHGELLKPTALLTQLGQEGRSFGDWSAE